MENSNKRERVGARPFLTVKFSSRASYRDEDGELVMSSFYGDVGVLCSGLVKTESGELVKFEAYTSIFHGTSKENKEVLERLSNPSTNLTARKALDLLETAIVNGATHEKLFRRVGSRSGSSIRDYRFVEDMERIIRYDIIGKPSPVISMKRMAKLSELYAERLREGNNDMPSLMKDVINYQWKVVSLKQFAELLGRNLFEK